MALFISSKPAAANCPAFVQVLFWLLVIIFAFPNSLDFSEEMEA